MNAVQSWLKKPTSLHSCLVLLVIAALLYPAWQIGGVIAEGFNQRVSAALK